VNVLFAPGRAALVLGVLLCVAVLVPADPPPLAQTVTLDTSPAGRRQVIDGFGTCLSSTEGLLSWWQSLYFDDLQCSVLRMDLTPRFKPPYTGMNGTYNSPWYHGNPYFPGPDGNNVRAYTNAADYRRSYNGWTAPIAVMGPDINQNTNCLDFSSGSIPVAGRPGSDWRRQEQPVGRFQIDRFPLVAGALGKGFFRQSLPQFRWDAHARSRHALALHLV
jgi:hypothetical protein